MAIDVRSKYPSMVDVARIAGVSKATVSNVLNRKPYVAEETASRVLDACREVGYNINTNLQDFIRTTLNGTTRNIALIRVRMSFSDPASARDIDGIARMAEENGFHLAFARLRGDETNIYDLPPIIRDKRIDGMLVTGILNERIILLLKEVGLPYVVMGNYSAAVIKDSPVVETDLATGVYMVVEALKQAGRKRIAFFNETLEHYAARQSLAAFKTALRENGLECYEELIYIGSGEYSGAFGVLKDLFLQDELPFDAVFCPDYRTATEISHLCLAYYGLRCRPDIILATVPVIFEAYRLPVPAIYMDIDNEVVAYTGAGILLEMLVRPGGAIPGRMLLCPTVRTAL